MELCLSRIHIGPVRIVLTTEDRVEVYHKGHTGISEMIAQAEFEELEDDAKTVVRALADLAD